MLIKLFRVVRIALEIDYQTGEFLAHHNVCPECNRHIELRNSYYRDLNEYFSRHVATLALLRATHMEDISA